MTEIALQKFQDSQVEWEKMICFPKVESSFFCKRKNNFPLQFAEYRRYSRMVRVLRINMTILVSNKWHIELQIILSNRIFPVDLQFFKRNISAKLKQKNQNKRLPIERIHGSELVASDFLVLVYSTKKELEKGKDEGM